MSNADNPNAKLLLDYFRLREALTNEEFVAEHNYPVLVQERAPEDERDGGYYSTIFLSKQLREGKIPEDMARPERGVVLRVTKSDTNLFEGMINLGRANNNDIILDASGASKFHAYISRDPNTEKYFITDANSKNGTFLNREPIRPYAPSVVKDDDRLCFAGQLEFTFYTPKRFYEMLGILIA